MINSVNAHIDLRKVRRQLADELPECVTCNMFSMLCVAGIASKHVDLNRNYLQRLVYFTQSLGKLPSDYHFAIDYTGPFSRDLISDVSMSVVLGYMYNRATALPTPDALYLIEDNRTIVNVFRSAVECVICTIGRKKNLKLLSIIHYMNAKNRGFPVYGGDNFLDVVCNQAEYSKACDDLCTLGLLGDEIKKPQLQTHGP